MRHPLARARRARPPPRADLPVPWAVEERHGWVWLAPERTTTAAPPRPSRTPVPEPVPGAAGAGRAGVRQPRPLARARLAPGGRCPASCGRAAGCRSGCSAAPGCCAATSDGAGRGSAGVRRPGAPRRWSGWLRPSRSTLPLDVPGGGRPPLRQRLAAAGALARARPDRWPTRCSTPRTCRSCTAGRSSRSSARRRRGARRVPAPSRSTRTRSRGRSARDRRAAPAGHRLPGAVPAAPAAGAADGRRRLDDRCSCCSPRTPTRPGVYARVLLSAGPGQPAPGAVGRGRRRWPSSTRCSRRTSRSLARTGTTGLPLDVRAGAARAGRPAGGRAAPGAVRLRDGAAGGRPPPDARSASQSPGAPRRRPGSGWAGPRRPSARTPGRPGAASRPGRRPRRRGRDRAGVGHGTVLPQTEVLDALSRRDRWWARRCAPGSSGCARPAARGRRG